jgi:predicted TIM-barrel fold metal-dependent hydrolase
MQITNCHIHTFTHDHVPDRWVPRPVGLLLRSGPIRRLLLRALRHISPDTRDKYERYAQILELSYAAKHQEGVFETVRGYYPTNTRFIVLPMDMELMGAGKVDRSIADQHEELARLCGKYPELIIPFAAVDARRDDVETTKRLINEHGFRGIKLYPPIGSHPNDPALAPLYAYAEAHGVPVMTHCSRPAGVRYRGKATKRMLTDPLTGGPLMNPGTGKPFGDGDIEGILTVFTDPDSYVPILERYPALRICLAHFGGAGDWGKYLNNPWHQENGSGEQSWLAKIVDMIRSRKYDNLFTDISYTLFADDEYVHLLNVLLSDEHVAARVLFGSDFYVVESAKLEERRISIRVRSILGEKLFRRIAEENPKRFLGEAGNEPVPPMRLEDERADAEVLSPRRNR